MEHSPWQDFQRQFCFDPAHAWYLGVERERFLINGNGEPTPVAAHVIQALPVDGRFGPELSACQLEDRIGPTLLGQIRARFRHNDSEIDDACRAVGIHHRFLEVAPVAMTTAVYENGDGRYQRIAEKLGPEKLLAACQVAGTHIHVGMPDAETALRVYNGVCKHAPALVSMGDHSRGERLRLYQQVAGESWPEPYESWETYAEAARARGFFLNPRDCWDLIRISRHGTIEFRPFGVTENFEEIENWAAVCLALCREVR